MSLESFTIRAPADMHAHFRQGPMLESVLQFTASVCDIALGMPNIKPPITTLEGLREYHFIVATVAAKVNRNFRFLPVLYLTETLDPEVVRQAYDESERLAYAVKSYPRGATTNSADGVRDMENVYPVLEVMERIGMPLCIHGEVTEWNGQEVLQHERERIYVLEVLPKIQKRFPGLKIILEHASTAEAVEAVLLGPEGMIAATITPQHLMLTSADLFRGGARVHGVCMPIVKAHNDRVALRKAAQSGSPRFFAGTDSAPHPKKSKEAACCAFGAFTAPAMLPLYAQVFGEDGGLDDDEGVARFNNFMSLNGPEYYGVTPSTREVRMVRETWKPSFSIPVEDDEVVAFADPRAGFVNELWYRVAQN